MLDLCRVTLLILIVSADQCPPFNTAVYCCKQFRVGFGDATIAISSWRKRAVFWLDTRMPVSWLFFKLNVQGNTTVDLVAGGLDTPVTVDNVFEYVLRHCEYRMVKAVRESLEQLKQGIFDVLPRNALDNLTAEDLRLLLNGVGDIDVQALSSYTSFNDESGESSDKVVQFKRWFWQVGIFLSSVYLNNDG